MKRVIALVPLFVLLTVAFAKDRKPELPAVVTEARYVAVTTFYGDDLTNPRITVEDRKAVADMEEALRKWGRYKVTIHPKDADIVLLVRAANRATVFGGPNIHVGSDKMPPISTTMGGEATSTPDDMLAVYLGASGTDSAAMWRRTARNGFGSDMALFKAFKKAVEDSSTPKP